MSWTESFRQLSKRLYGSSMGNQCNTMTAAAPLLELDVESDAVNLQTTILKKTRCVIKWNIYNFSKYELPAGTCISSPIFKSDESGETTWRLHLYPKWTLFDNYVGVFLKKLSPFGQKIPAEYSFTILSDEKTPPESFENESVFEESGLGTGRLLHRAKLIGKEKDKYLPEDTLTVICKLDAKVDAGVPQPDEPEVDHSAACLAIMANNLVSLLKSEMYTDVTLRVGDRELRAHKVVLAGRSPVFNDMLEKLEDPVLVVTDMSFETLERLVSFAYCGETGEISVGQMIEMLPVAYKYGLPDLKRTCSQFLKTRLNTGNAPTVLTLANNHGDAELKHAAMKLICT